MSLFISPETTIENLAAVAQVQLRRPPVFSGELEVDASAMQAFLNVAESSLAGLPPKPERDVPQQRQAEAILALGRKCRRGFLQQHASEVYRAVIGHQCGHIALSELSFAVAQRFPGLTPSPAQIKREREHIQTDKDAYEIDQGLLFQAWLNLPDVGIDLISRMLQPTAKALALLPQFRSEHKLRLGAVQLERRGHAAHLTMHNVTCLNAEDDELVDCMETAVDLAMLHDEIKVCVLRGGEMEHPRYKGKRVFSAGINLKHLHRGQISFLDFLLRREFGYINKMAHGVLPDCSIDLANAIQKPWVGAVDTFAIGGGAQILLICDWVIAGSDAYFSLPAATEGIVPGAANLRLPRFTGSRLARQIILNGRKVYASDTEGTQLFDEVVKPSEIDAAVERSVERFGVPAVVANKKMLILSEDPLDQFRRYMAVFSREQSQRMYSVDVMEKVNPL